MAYLVYITELCRKEAKKHNFEQDLDRLKDSIEKNQRISQLDKSISQKFPVKKKFGSFQGRLITYEEVSTVANKDYTVIIFLTILIRGSNDYHEFHRNPEPSGNKLVSKIDREDLKKYLENAVAKNPPQNKALSEKEQAYLYSAGTTGYDLDNESLVKEADAWVKTINQEPFLSLLPRIYDTVKDICEIELEDINEHLISQRQEKIIFCFNKGEKCLSLLDLIKAENVQIINAAEIVEKWKQDLKDNISIAKRAYPQYILADDSFWMDIEKDPQSNFTLSREEIDVLNDCTRKNAFPLFINGRAGSGKSTMLQYLFADYFSRFVSYKDYIENPPVYFTYNSKLLQRAKIFVDKLLTCNSAFEKIRDNVQQDTHISGRLEDSFKELKVYLLSVVPSSDNARFDNSNYVAYPRFRNLWRERFKTDIKKDTHDYSPDISWHVIRTYIQGMDTDGYLEPEDYDELEEKQKTVSRQVYQIIYEKVWNWYKGIKQEKNLWDDQDLARYIIEKDLAKPIFPGVFCDEAQDFTRLDMEVILRLSLFSNRDIQKQDISIIPFAFAGDELQTLNPTGFRWEALKAGFTQKFILSLSTGSRDPVQTNLNYRELENNYRSLPSIVKFCNTLQLFRSVRFDISNLRPQKPWNTPSNMPVVYFRNDEAVFWEGIKKLTDTVFIIPCDEGEEFESIKEDPVLSKFFTIENDAIKDFGGVLSANQAKGLEFNHVVVYGFGEHCPSNMINGTPNEDPSVRLPLEYYINKTYVAISRAKRQLFIVDSEEGMKKLWDVTRNDQLIDGYIEKINEKNTKNWSLDNDLFLLIPGYASLMEDKEINMEEVASQFKQYGISSRTAHPLRQAASSYKILKQDVEANKCEAIAYIFDKKYLEAGTKYNESGWIDESIKSFWLANCDEGYNKIISIADRNPKYLFLFKIASSMINGSKETIVDAIETVATTGKQALYDIFKGDDIFPDYEMRNVLMHAVNAIVNKIKALIDIKTDSIILHRIIDIQNQGIKIETASIAEIAYTLNDYEKAKEYWEKSESRDTEKYNISRAYCAKYPESISLLKSVKRSDEIINQYNKNKSQKLSDEQLFAVTEAFLLQNDTENALQICTSITASDYFQQLSDVYSSSPKSDKKVSFIFHVLKNISMIRREEWNDIGRLTIAESGAKSRNDVSMILYIAAGLGRLTSLALLPKDSATKENIQIFLKKEVIEKYNSRSIDIPEEILIDIGTAVEKAGHRRDALDYYKHLESGVKNEELKLKGIERWIKAKERQAELTVDDEDLAEKRFQDALNKRGLYSIPENRKFAEYEPLSEWSDLYRFIIKNETSAPKIEIEKQITDILPPKHDGAKLKVISKKQKPDNEIIKNEQSQLTNSEFEMGGFKFAYFYQGNRLNITNKADGNFISIINGRYTSGDYSVEEEHFDGDVYKSIKGTPILFKNTDKIEIYFSDTKIRTSFDV